MTANDECRDRIIRFLYERHTTSRSVRKIPIGIRDLNREMKSRHGMKQQEVSSNLTYLIQSGWVRQETKSWVVPTKNGILVNSEQTKYQIPNLGINHLETATMFKASESGRTVNITNVQGVTVVGDGNVVNAQFTELSRAIDDLDSALARSQQLTDEQKLDAAGDLSTIRTQIGKKHPNPSIIRSAWECLKSLPLLGNAAEALTKVGNLISSIVN